MMPLIIFIVVLAVLFIPLLRELVFLLFKMSFAIALIFGAWFIVFMLGAAS